MKGLRALLLMIVVLGLIAVGAASLWLGRGVKVAIERFGPEIVGAPVTIGAVVLTPWSGRGAITNLVIGNPPGFKGPHALSVGSVEVKIRLASLVTDTVVVESVVVREPEILYELGSGGSNIARLQHNAEAGKSKPAAAQGGKSMLIRELKISGGQIGVSAAPLGGSAVKIPLPGVQLSNLGGKGHSPAEAAAEVLGSLSASVSRAVTGLGTKALNSAASSVMGRLSGLLKGKK